MKLLFHKHIRIFTKISSEILEILLTCLPFLRESRVLRSAKNGQIAAENLNKVTARVHERSVPSDPRSVSAEL